MELALVWSIGRSHALTVGVLYESTIHQGVPPFDPPLVGSGVTGWGSAKFRVLVVTGAVGAMPHRAGPALLEPVHVQETLGLKPAAVAVVVPGPPQTLDIVLPVGLFNGLNVPLAVGMGRLGHLRVYVIDPEMYMLYFVEHVDDNGGDRYGHDGAEDSGAFFHLVEPNVFYLGLPLGLTERLILLLEC